MRAGALLTTLWSVVLFVGMSRAEAESELVLDEAELIRLVLARAPESAVADATAALAEAHEHAAGLLPNPSLSWGRETVETGPVGSQDIVSAALPIELSRPRTARALAASEGASLRAEAALQRDDAVLAALFAYYDIVIGERRLAVFEEVLANLEEAARVLSRREAAGTVSGYESIRLSIESELARSRLVEARGQLERARAGLAVLLGVDVENLRVTQELHFLSESQLAQLVQRGVESREALRHAGAAVKLAAEAEQRAELTWLPSLEVSGGMKRVSDLGGGVGYVVGISLALPSLDRGQGLRAEARARRAVTAARGEALAQRLGVEAEAALVTYRSTRENLERLEAQTNTHVESLLRAVQSGYREGERSILELLDAQRARTEVAERRLTLMRMAKRAEAEARVALGELR